MCYVHPAHTKKPSSYISGEHVMQLPAPEPTANALFIAILALARHSAWWLMLPGGGRYTGEDGFEISVPNSHGVALAEQLVANKRVRLAGECAAPSLADNGRRAGGPWPRGIRPYDDEDDEDEDGGRGQACVVAVVSVMLGKGASRASAACCRMQPLPAPRHTHPSPPSCPCFPLVCTIPLPLPLLPSLPVKAWARATLCAWRLGCACTATTWTRASPPWRRAWPGPLASGAARRLISWGVTSSRSSWLRASGGSGGAWGVGAAAGP